MISKAILKMTHINSSGQLTELVPGSSGGVARISGADISRASWKLSQIGLKQPRRQ
jgi:hypothetical protein